MSTNDHPQKIAENKRHEVSDSRWWAKIKSVISINLCVVICVHRHGDWLVQTAFVSIEFLDIKAKLEVLPSWNACIFLLFIKTKGSCQVPSTGCFCICARMMKTAIVSIHWNMVVRWYCCYKTGILVSRCANEIRTDWCYLILTKYQRVG